MHHRTFGGVIPGPTVDQVVSTFLASPKKQKNDAMESDKVEMRALMIGHTVQIKVR